MIVVDAAPAHIPSLLAQMGHDRIVALVKRAGSHPETEIAANIARSPVSWAFLDDDRVVALGGAIPSGSAGYVWQFVTDAVRSNKRAYLTASRCKIAEGLKRFGALVTFIEASNPAALRHCRRNGFEIGHAQEIGGELAHICVRRRA